MDNGKNHNYNVENYINSNNKTKIMKSGVGGMQGLTSNG